MRRYSGQAVESGGPATAGRKQENLAASVTQGVTGPSVRGMCFPF
nr:hypothetical protein [Pseudomonas oleovorans]